MHLRLALAVCLPLLSACIATAPLTCTGGASARPVAELVFGRNIGPSLGVSEAAWRDFVDAEVTPRFPDGFTMLEARGQWRDGAAIVREPSKVLVLLLPDAATAAPQIQALVDSYKRRFRQESVLVTTTPACLRF